MRWGDIYKQVCTLVPVSLFMDSSVGKNLYLGTVILGNEQFRYFL